MSFYKTDSIDEVEQLPIHQRLYVAELRMGEQPIIAAPTLTHLIGGFVPDYLAAVDYSNSLDESSQSPDHDWTQWNAEPTPQDIRYEYARAAASALGTHLLGTGDEDAGHELSEEELNFLIGGGQTPQGDPFTGKWESELTLTAVRTDYEPFGDHDLPTGNINFIDPSNEATFVQTLRDSGFLAGYLVHEDA